MDVSALIDKYERTVRGVENQSCDCSGQILSGEEWRERGCGWSPEYWHDVDSRESLHALLESGSLTSGQVERVNALDWRLKKLLSANGVSVSGDRFWRNGLPLGVAE